MIECYNFVFSIVTSSLIWSTNATFLTSHIHEKVFKVTNHNKNINSVILKSVVTSQLQCIHRCKLQIGCQNINYNLKTKECQLLDGESIVGDEEGIEVDEHWNNAYLLNFGEQATCKHRDVTQPYCPVFYKEEVKVLSDSIITTIPIWYPSWKIKLDIIPYEIIMNSYPSILHLTIEGNENIHGYRIPGLWFKIASTQLIVHSSINGDPNMVHESATKLPLNTTSHIEISQIYQSDAKYRFTFSINGTEDFSIINNDARQWENVKVFASDPWYISAKVVIKNLVLMNYV